MARTNRRLGWLIILVLALALLYALNPSTADFQAWRSAEARRQAGAGTGLIGALKKGAGAIAGAMTGGIAGLYSRHDYLVCSSYTLGSDEYLGIARMFVKIK
jgi:hypothetical protein